MGSEMCIRDRIGVPNVSVSISSDPAAYTCVVSSLFAHGRPYAHLAGPCELGALCLGLGRCLLVSWFVENPSFERTMTHGIPMSVKRRWTSAL